jgi:hypothetical protein
MSLIGAAVKPESNGCDARRDEDGKDQESVLDEAVGNGVWGLTGCAGCALAGTTAATQRVHSAKQPDRGLEPRRDETVTVGPGVR